MNNTKVFGALIASAVAGMTLSNIANADGGKDAAYCQNNSCKGKSACGGHGNDCHGKNECKGKGWVKAKDEAECKAHGGAWTVAAHTDAPAAPAKKMKK